MSRTPSTADVFARAFTHDPVTAAILPRNTYVHRRRLYRAVELSAPFAVDTIDSAAAALWRAPGSGPGIGRARALPWLLGAFGPHVLPIVRVGAAKRGLRPSGAYWHLALLGVVPERQGEGLGSLLLERGLRRADADRLPAYLECSTISNLPLYERLGFVVQHEVEVAPGVREWTMLRGAVQPPA